MRSHWFSLFQIQAAAVKLEWLYEAFSSKLTIYHCWSWICVGVTTQNSRHCKAKRCHKRFFSVGPSAAGGDVSLTNFLGCIHFSMSPVLDFKIFWDSFQKRHFNLYHFVVILCPSCSFGHGTFLPVRHQTPTRTCCPTKGATEKGLGLHSLSSQRHGPFAFNLQGWKSTAGSSSVHMVFLYVYNRKPNMELPKRICKTFWSDFLTGRWPCLKLKGLLLCTSTEISDIHATCIAFPSFDKSIQGMVFWPVPSNQLFFRDFLIVLDTACLKGWLSSSKVQTMTCLSFHKSAQQMVVWHTGEKSIGTLLQRSSLIYNHTYGTYAFVLFFTWTC